MANLSDYGRNAVLDGIAMPATLYVKLHLGDPTGAGTANPAALTTRKAVTRDAAVAGVAYQTALARWTAAPADEDVTHLSWWDAATGGNCWWVAALPAPVSVELGGNVELQPDATVMRVEGWSN